jgi:hypothetical protein
MRPPEKMRHSHSIKRGAFRLTIYYRNFIKQRRPAALY